MILGETRSTSCWSMKPCTKIERSGFGLKFGSGTIKLLPQRDFRNRESTLCIVFCFALASSVMTVAKNLSKSGPYSLYARLTAASSFFAAGLLLGVVGGACFVMEAPGGGAS
jgi:hypothetical protein